jgi:sigma-E factor negative regulatory protein RseA
MNTKETTRERTSALADGELPDAQLDLALAALRNDEARADWELYHRIGDALRSEDVADTPLSAGFSARLAARLDAEPTIIAPAALPAASAKKANARRWAVPGLAAATAMAGIAFFTTPQLMVALSEQPAPAVGQAVIAEVKQAAAVVPVAAAPGAEAAGSEVVLRDAHIDDYLLAHQRLSPSVYSSAQYARSATLATESGK